MKKIYTKAGDDGTTQLLSGKRVAKYHLRVEAYGNVDELTSHIGFLRGLKITEKINSELIYIQHVLFDISGLLSCDSGKHINILNAVTEESIIFLENSIDKISNELPQLKKFILPGGQMEVAYCHICRTICRRTERIIVKLADNETIANNIIVFMNRLSDYFFILSRKIAKDNNFEQTTVK